MDRREKLGYEQKLLGAAGLQETLTKMPTMT